MIPNNNLRKCTHFASYDGPFLSSRHLLRCPQILKLSRKSESAIPCPNECSCGGRRPRYTWRGLFTSCLAQSTSLMTLLGLLVYPGRSLCIEVLLNHANFFKLLPQIIINYRRHDTEGLQASMMLLWAAAGVPLGVYNIVEDFNVALRIQPQILTILSLITWAQCLYYGKVFLLVP